LIKKSSLPHHERTRGEESDYYWEESSPKSRDRLFHRLREGEKAKRGSRSLKMKVKRLLARLGAQRKKKKAVPKKKRLKKNLPAPSGPGKQRFPGWLVERQEKNDFGENQAGSAHTSEGRRPSLGRKKGVRRLSGKESRQRKIRRRPQNLRGGGSGRTQSKPKSEHMLFPKR